MGIVSNVEAENRAAEIVVEGGSAERLFGGGVVTDAGIRVADKDAKQYSAFFNAVYLISSYLGMISLKVYERRDDGGKSEAREHPLFDTLHQKPNPEMSATSLRETLQGHILLRGNAYAEVQRNGNGQTTRLWPLSPTNTQLRRTKNGQPFYETTAGSNPVRLPFDQVFHVPGLGGDGRTGWSILKLARESVGMGLASEKYGAKFFQNSAKPSGILVAPDEMPQDARQTLRDAWEVAQGGLDQAQRTAVLDRGIEWQSIGMSNEDAQFLELRQHQVEEIARWFNIPPHKIKDLRRATFDNISQEQISFLQDTIQPWLNRWEQAINTQLLTERERRRGLFAEFNVDTVLRSDPEQRASMMRRRFQTGSWSPNDIRAKENENPIEEDGADSYFVQSNMITLDQAQSLPPAARAMLKATDEADPETLRVLAEAYKEELRTGETSGTSDEGSKEVRQDGDGAVDERQRLRGAFRPLIEDAAGRLVRAETQDIQSELGRLFEEGGAAAFIEFLDEFYDRNEGQIAGIIERTVEPTFESYTRAVADAVADDLGADVDDEFIERLLQDSDRGLVTNFIDKHAAASRKQLQALAREEPEGDQLPREIVEERLNEWRNGRDDEGPPRSEKIADRETVGFGEASAVAVMSLAGVTLLRWDIAGEACPICQTLDGAIVGIESKFLGEGDTIQTDEVNFTTSHGIGHPPAHLSCNCIVTAE